MDTNLFNLRNWYLVGNKKNCISDGTVDGQADSLNRLLPCVPVQMLVVRKVRIGRELGQRRKTMEKLFGNSGGAWDKTTAAGMPAPMSVSASSAPRRMSATSRQGRRDPLRQGR